MRTAVLHNGYHPRYTDKYNPLNTINQYRIPESFPLKVDHIKGTSAGRHALNMLIGVVFW